MKENIRKIINIPNLFFILLLISFKLPSKFAAEMRGGLKPVWAFFTVIILIEIAFFKVDHDNSKMMNLYLDK